MIPNFRDGKDDDILVYRGVSIGEYIFLIFAPGSRKPERITDFGMFCVSGLNGKAWQIAD